MTERDRLIKLLCNVECVGEEGFYNCPERRSGICRIIHRLEMCQVGAIADHLLANGIIVPPVKVGDKVFQTDGIRIYESAIREITYTSSKVIYVTENIVFDETAIGTSIFLAREEAEQALKERTMDEEGLHNN